MIKAIIFDLWNTIAVKENSISQTLKKGFNIDESTNFLKRYEETVQLDNWKSHDEMAVCFLDSFKIPYSQPNKNFVISAFKEGTKNSVLQDGIKELLEKLHKNYKLAILSNTTVFETIQGNWGIEQFFDTVIYSWQIGSLKPGRESFEYVCKELNVKLEDSLLIDDRLENIIAAKSYGFNAIQYKNVRELKKELESYKIKLL